MFPQIAKKKKKPKIGTEEMLKQCEFLMKQLDFKHKKSVKSLPAELVSDFHKVCNLKDIPAFYWQYFFYFVSKAPKQHVEKHFACEVQNIMLGRSYYQKVSLLLKERNEEILTLKQQMLVVEGFQIMNSGKPLGMSLKGKINALISNCTSLDQLKSIEATEIQKMTASITKLRQNLKQLIETVISWQFFLRDMVSNNNINPQKSTAGNGNHNINNAASSTKKMKIIFPQNGINCIFIGLYDMQFLKSSFLSQQVKFSNITNAEYDPFLTEITPLKRISKTYMQHFFTPLNEKNHSYIKVQTYLFDCIPLPVSEIKQKEKQEKNELRRATTSEKKLKSTLSIEKSLLQGHQQQQRPRSKQQMRKSASISLLTNKGSKKSQMVIEQYVSSKLLLEKGKLSSTKRLDTVRSGNESGVAEINTVSNDKKNINLSSKKATLLNNSRLLVTEPLTKQQHNSKTTKQKHQQRQKPQNLINIDEIASIYQKKSKHKIKKDSSLQQNKQKDSPQKLKSSMIVFLQQREHEISSEEQQQLRQNQQVQNINKNINSNRNNPLQNSQSKERNKRIENIYRLSLSLSASPKKQRGSLVLEKSSSINSIKSGRKNNNNNKSQQQHQLSESIYKQDRKIKQSYQRQISNPKKSLDQKQHGQSSANIDVTQILRQKQELIKQLKSQRRQQQQLRKIIRQVQNRKSSQQKQYQTKEEYYEKEIEKLKLKMASGGERMKKDGQDNRYSTGVVEKSNKLIAKVYQQHRKSLDGKDGKKTNRNSNYGDKSDANDPKLYSSNLSQINQNHNNPNKKNPNLLQLSRSISPFNNPQDNLTQSRLLQNLHTNRLLESKLKQLTKQKLNLQRLIEKEGQKTNKEKQLYQRKLQKYQEIINNLKNQARVSKSVASDFQRRRNQIEFAVKRQQRKQRIQRLYATNNISMKKSSKNKQQLLQQQGKITKKTLQAKIQKQQSPENSKKKQTDMVGENSDLRITNSRNTIEIVYNPNKKRGKQKTKHHDRQQNRLGDQKQLVQQQGISSSIKEVKKTSQKQIDKYPLSNSRQSPSYAKNVDLEYSQQLAKLAKEKTLLERKLNLFTEAVSNKQSTNQAKLLKKLEEAERRFDKYREMLEKQKETELKQSDRMKEIRNRINEEYERKLERQRANFVREKERLQERVRQQRDQKQQKDRYLSRQVVYLKEMQLRQQQLLTMMQRERQQRQHRQSELLLQLQQRQQRLQRYQIEEIKKQIQQQVRMEMRLQESNQQKYEYQKQLEQQHRHQLQGQSSAVDGEQRLDTYNKVDENKGVVENRQLLEQQLRELMANTEHELEEMDEENQRLKQLIQRIRLQEQRVIASLKLEIYQQQEQVEGKQHEDQQILNEQQNQNDRQQKEDINNDNQEKIRNSSQTDEHLLLNYQQIHQQQQSTQIVKQLQLKVSRQLESEHKNKQKLNKLQESPQYKEREKLQHLIERYLEMPAELMKPTEYMTISMKNTQSNNNQPLNEHQRLSKQLEKPHKQKQQQQQQPKQTPQSQQQSQKPFSQTTNSIRKLRQFQNELMEIKNTYNYFNVNDGMQAEKDSIGMGHLLLLRNQYKDQEAQQLKKALFPYMAVGDRNQYAGGYFLNQRDVEQQNNEGKYIEHQLSFQQPQPPAPITLKDHLDVHQREYLKKKQVQQVYGNSKISNKTQLQTIGDNIYSLKDNNTYINKGNTSLNNTRGAKNFMAINRVKLLQIQEQLKEKQRLMIQQQTKKKLQRMRLKQKRKQERQQQEFVRIKQQLQEKQKKRQLDLEQREREYEKQRQKEQRRKKNNSISYNKQKKQLKKEAKNGEQNKQKDKQEKKDSIKKERTINTNQHKQQQLQQKRKAKQLEKTKRKQENINDNDDEDQEQQNEFLMVDDKQNGFLILSEQKQKQQEKLQQQEIIRKQQPQHLHQQNQQKQMLQQQQSQQQAKQQSNDDYQDEQFQSQRYQQFQGKQLQQEEVEINGRQRKEKEQKQEQKKTQQQKNEDEENEFLLQQHDDNINQQPSQQQLIQQLLQQQKLSLKQDILSYQSQIRSYISSYTRFHTYQHFLKQNQLQSYLKQILQLSSTEIKQLNNNLTLFKDLNNAESVVILIATHPQTKLEIGIGVFHKQYEQSEYICDYLLAHNMDNFLALVFNFTRYIFQSDSLTNCVELIFTVNLLKEQQSKERFAEFQDKCKRLGEIYIKGKSTNTRKYVLKRELFEDLRDLDAEDHIQKNKENKALVIKTKVQIHENYMKQKQTYLQMTQKFNDKNFVNLGNQNNNFTSPTFLLSLYLKNNPSLLGSFKTQIQQNLKYRQLLVTAMIFSQKQFVFNPINENVKKTQQKISLYKKLNDRFQIDDLQQKVQQVKINIQQGLQGKFKRCILQMGQQDINYCMFPFAQSLNRCQASNSSQIGTFLPLIPKYRMLIIPADEFLTLSQSNPDMNVFFYTKHFIKNITEVKKETISRVFLPQIKFQNWTFYKQLSEKMKKTIFGKDQFKIGYQNNLKNSVLFKPRHNDFVFEKPLIVSVLSANVQRTVEGTPIFCTLIC